MTDQPTLPIEVAVEPKSRADAEQLAAAVATLATQDPCFGHSIDLESGQLILKGVSERQLDIAAGRIIHEFGVDARFGAPQVAFRERLTRRVEAVYTHKKLIGGSGEFARVRIRFEPLPLGSGFIFENAVINGAVPSDCVRGVEKGLNASRENGVVAGFPLIDFKATLIDGAYHDVDSNRHTFEIAARAAFRELKALKAVTLLEPIMNVEIVTPGEFADKVIADLGKRRGEMRPMQARDNSRVIVATVPLANLFGYEAELHALAGGRASSAMTFSHYAPMDPPDDDPPFRPAMGMRA